MFVIITYDVEQKRVNKVHKILKKYLIWAQNSVFEGEISQGALKNCLFELEKVIDGEADSICVYKVSNPRNIRKQTYGQEKCMDSFFI